MSAAVRWFNGLKMLPGERGLDLRDVGNPVLLLYRGPHVVRQLARDLGGVDTADVAIQALPLCHPRLAGVGERDEPFKDLRRAAVDLVGRALQVQELFAVGAAFVAEALLGDVSMVVPGI